MECFASAYLAAGSCYVFGTLWQVDGNDCKDFALAFYEALTGPAQGDPAQALLLARKKLSQWSIVAGQAGKEPTRARWGAFVLMGTTACPPKEPVPREEMINGVQQALSSLAVRN